MTEVKLCDADFNFIHWEKDSGGPEQFELIIHGKSEEDCNQIKQQILNNHAIVDELRKDLKEHEEYFREPNDDVKRRILDYHIVMAKAVLSTTDHSKCSGGTK